jgi:hypothetical protein
VKNPQVPATALAREAIDSWLRHDAIAEFAAQKRRVPTSTSTTTSNLLELTIS